MPSPRTLEQARRAALRGDVDPAVSALRELAAKGDDSACASLAELLAFRGEWAECIGAAGRLVASPSAVYSGDVFDDMVRLLGRAGHETGRWKEVEEAAAEGERRAARSGARDHLRKRWTTILDGLRRYARRQGAPPHELIMVFGARSSMSPGDAAGHWRDAAANVDTLRPDLRGRPDDLAVHLFGLARTFGQDDEALRLFAEHEPLLHFDAGVHVARILARRGADADAWRAIEGRIGRWWPCDVAQVAPTELLTDDVLRPLMTPERRETVLRTPRGREAAR